MSLMRTYVLWFLVIGLVFVWPSGIALAQLLPDEADTILEIAGTFKAKLEDYHQLVKDLRTELFQCAKPLQDLIKNITTAIGSSVNPTKDCLAAVLEKILPPTLDPIPSTETTPSPPEKSLFELRSEVLAALEQLRSTIVPFLRIKRTAELAKLLDSRWKSMRSFLNNESLAIAQAWQRVASNLLTLDEVAVLLDDAKTYDEKQEPDKAAALRAQAKEALQGKVWQTLLQATQLFSRSFTFLRHTTLVINLLINTVIRRTIFAPEAFSELGASLATPEPTAVQVYDTSGRLLWRSNSPEGLKELAAQTRAWPNGVYWMLIMQGAQHRELRKFIVLR